MALAGLATGIAVQAQTVVDQPSGPNSSDVLGVPELPVGTVIAPGIFIKPSGAYFNPQGGGMAVIVQSGTTIGPQGQEPAIGREGSGTRIGPQANQPAIGRQGSGTAMGPQANEPRIGQQGSIDIGQQGSTAIGPQSSQPAIGQQGSGTQIGPQQANNLTVWPLQPNARTPLPPTGRFGDGTEIGPQGNGIEIGQQGSGTAIGPQSNQPALVSPVIGPVVGTPPPAAFPQPALGPQTVNSSTVGTPPPAAFPNANVPGARSTNPPRP